MRMLKLAVALIAVSGWAASAHAGTVTKVYDVSSAYGTTWTRVWSIYTLSPSTLMGQLGVSVYTTASTFTSHQSNPPVTAWVHMQPSGTITAMVQLALNGWKIASTVSLHVQGSTACHVGTHTAKSDTVVPASCHLAGLQIKTKAHCTGHGFLSGARCLGGFGTLFGCWTGKSDYHTQTWNAKSIHCGAIKFSHTSMSAHYMKSCNAKLVPPTAHTCGSGSGPHLASSDSGYRVLHVGAKLRSTP